MTSGSRTPICLAKYELVWHSWDSISDWIYMYTPMQNKASSITKNVSDRLVTYGAEPSWLRGHKKARGNSSTEQACHCIQSKALSVPPAWEAHVVIPIMNIQPVHQFELWLYIFYIITDIESIDILIKGSEYWVGAPTAHQLSLPRGVDSHNPLRGAASSIKSLWHGGGCWRIWSTANFKG